MIRFSRINEFQFYHTEEALRQDPERIMSLLALMED